MLLLVPIQSRTILHMKSALRKRLTVLCRTTYILNGEGAERPLFAIMIALGPPSWLLPKRTSSSVRKFEFSIQDMTIIICIAELNVPQVVNNEAGLLNLYKLQQSINICINTYHISEFRYGKRGTRKKKERTAQTKHPQHHFPPRASTALS